jgi:predicted ATPase/DNA-binding NarL/FixJ family response regulator
LLRRPEASTPVGGRVIDTALLPRPRSQAFGRDEDIGAVIRLFADGARLVTITGAGGIGKTRVAVEAAARIDGRAAFVALAGVDADGLLPALLRHLAPSASAGGDPVAVIADAMSDIPMLLVLDTFEHVIEHAEMVGELLDRCPALRILISSRSRLRVDGEHVISLSGLSADAAVAMFLNRARAVSGQIADTDRPVITEVCRHLDGVPLAIELAAARTPMLAPSALLARMQSAAPDAMLSVLARGPDARGHRHRSMRDTIAWSHVLLDPSAQLVLRRCSAFPNSFGLDAAEQVSGCDVLDAVAALVDLHLLEPVDGPDAAPRFRMLDAIREFGAALLDDDADRAGVHARLADWADAFGHAAGAGLLSADERYWLEQVDVELPTLRRVLARLAQDKDTRRGLRLAARIAPFWLHRGPMSEGRTWLATLLDTDPDGEQVGGVERAVATAWAGRLSLDEGDLSVAEDISHSRDVIARDPDAVTEWLQATEHLAYALTLRGDLAQADELTAEGAERAAKAQDKFWQAVFLQRRALSAERRGDLQLAAHYARETVQAAGAIGYERVIARAEHIIAQVRAVGADHLAAHRLLIANLHAHRDSGDLRGVVTSMATLGSAWQAADPAVSARWYRDGLDEGRRIGYWHGEAYCVIGLAATAAGAGRSADAVSLDAALQPHLAVIKAGLPPHYFDAYEQSMAQARAVLGDASHAAVVDAPTHWPNIRRRAREVADRLGATTARTELAAGPTRRRGPSANPELTEREEQILRSIVAGGTNPQIAAQLGLSPKTVMHHSSSIYRKLGVRGRAEAIAHAYRIGIVKHQN